LRRHTGGGKEIAMNDALPNPDPAPADAPPAPDVGRQLVELSDAVRRLAESQQTLLDALAPARRDTSARTPQSQPSGADDVRRIVLDVLREHDQQRHRADGRDRYVRQRMSDLPDAYRRLMPQTDDPTALATAERDVRRQFREDLRAIGAGDPAGNDLAADSTTTAGQRPGAAVDYSTLSPLQQIAVGLRDVKPAGAGRATGSGRAQPATGGAAGTDNNEQGTRVEPVSVGAD
jgi:hypothetical protein